MTIELIHLGIEPPKKCASTADEMRLAILEASRDSSLIRNCIDRGTAMIIQGKHLTESERLQWHARHRQEDALLEDEQVGEFDPITWTDDAWADPAMRRYAPDPLAATESDDQGDPLYELHSSIEEVNKSVWRACLALALWLGLAVAVVLLLAGVNPVALVRAWWAA